MDDKKALRNRFSAIRAAVTDKERKNIEIAERLLSLNRIKSADAVLLYASFRSEADTRLITEKLLELNIKTAFPLCGSDGLMTFHIISSADDLISGSYGIKEPKFSLPQPEITGKTVCIVPGLAFTENGGRLGYGGGYYDRFLSVNPQIFTIALAYEEQIVPRLPLMQHDHKVNSIVTEERMVLCNE